jgi:hypothetical protein
MSKNFVLVQYGNQTRKIQGDPTRKKYNALVRQIQDKFEFDHDVNIQVYDRVNQQYFAIDKSEVREIQNGGKIKVTKKGGGGKKGQSGGKKGKGSPLKPPGVPPPTEEDDAKRVAWRKNTKVEIYSETALKWIPGQIQTIYTDNEGEWLVIRYTKAKGGISTKEIQRFSNYIRPVAERKRAKKQKEKQTQNGDKKKEQPKRKEREQRQKPQKITTQSKYRKVKAPLGKEDVAENVVEFKGNGHIKQFIDRTCILLRGPKEVPHEEVKSAEDDEKVDDNQPSQKFDVVHMTGVGRAMSSVVSAAEIVKRIVPGLHQETKMVVKELIDVYEPTEAGLKNVEVSRSITGIQVTLSVHGKEVDQSAAGYQAPEQYEDGFGAIEYEYPDEKKARKGRGGRRKKQAKN